MSLSRLDKEKQMYEKEVLDQRTKIDKMKRDNKDDHDIRKQVCCLCTLYTVSCV